MPQQHLLPDRRTVSQALLSCPIENYGTEREVLKAGS